jgi:hypothetical protein
MALLKMHRILEAKMRLHERSWISEERRNPIRGFTHTDKMRTVERYRRTSHGTLEAEMTVIDPEVL